MFWDRWGNPHTPAGSDVVKNREGAFSCCVHRAHLLLIWPNYAPAIPELPGGGIDPGESPLEANQREFAEETGFDLAIVPDEIENYFQQQVNFYANDVNEYWHYKQHFYLITKKLEDVFFEVPKPTPEKGTMQWVSLENLAKLSLHTMHEKAIIEFALF